MAFTTLQTKITNNLSVKGTMWNNYKNCVQPSLFFDKTIMSTTNRQMIESWLMKTRFQYSTFSRLKWVSKNSPPIFLYQLAPLCFRLHKNLFSFTTLPDGLMHESVIMYNISPSSMYTYADVISTCVINISSSRRTLRNVTNAWC